MGPYHKTLIFGSALLLLLAACSSGSGIQTEPVKPGSGTGPGEFSAEALGASFVQTGVASWYGGRFQGRRTANGEIYDMYRLTAAHNTLPFNSIVEVENLENHRKTIVRINDRGPFVKNRVIDLSLKAARLLGVDEKGTARVCIRLLKPAEVSETGALTANTAGYQIQAGAFVSRMNAYDLMQQLNEIVQETKFKIQLTDGYHRVVSGRMTGLDQVKRVIKRLETFGFGVFIKRY